jgi:adenylate cyclase
MRFSLFGYLACVLGWIAAASLFILIRFVGLSSVPAFATFDYTSLNHGLLFAKATAHGFIVGNIFYGISRVLDTPVMRQRPYGMLILLHSLMALLSVTLLLSILSIADAIAQNKVLSFAVIKPRIMSVNFIVLLTYSGIVSFIFVMIEQINRKFGPGNLRKLITGTYYHPREVELIFMFLDLKDSTTHAERLGHQTFGSLIQDCFIDMSVVSDFKAEFYQYVGDESILFWDVEDGLSDANCLQAYFAFKQRLERRRDYYLARYGFMPEFKAGVNIGLATVLEVGEIKREIAYLGDVLNTAARIQGACKVHQEELLISEPLRARLLALPNHLAIDPIGTTDLRGKVESVGLYCVREMQEEPVHT